MSWEVIINGAVGAGAMAIILRLLDHYFNRNKVKAETTVMRSEASENITEAAQVAMNLVLQALNQKNLETQDLLRDVKELKQSQKENSALILELQQHRDERTRQIDELTENNEALLSQVAALRAQIAKDTAETRDLRKRHEDYKKALILIFENNPDLNLPPELAVLLGDSINGLKIKKQ